MHKNQPLVSILIANYNNGTYILEAIKSVVNQTYKNWEIIIVDDASTDGSWSIINQIAKTYGNIRIYRNEKNLKVAATKAKATDLANGEICAILDPDDALIPEAIEKHVKTYIKLPDCSVAGSNYYHCDEQLQIKSVNQKIYNPNQFQSYLASEGGIHHFWSFSKAKYYTTQGFDANFILAEDQDLFYKLEEVGKVCIINEPLYYYRAHQNAISQGDKIALAYTYHVLAMFAAKSRRPKNKKESQVIQAAVLHFMTWGIMKIKKPMRLRLFKSIVSNFPKLLLKRTVMSAFWVYLKNEINYD